MKINLISLKLQNFKKTKDATYQFDGQNTDIYGDNAVGKSTIYDAFSWLLFDKNSQGDTKFDMKPYGVERPEVTVTGVISVDGKQIELKKTLTETWTKKRGDETETFTGHASEFWINSIPKKGGEYKAFIDAMVTEEKFKRLTNASYFLNMKKPEMRSVLIDISGDISNSEVAKEDSEQLSLVALMDEKGCSVDDLLKLCKQNVSLYTKEQDTIAPRVDENRRTLSEEVDYSKLGENLATGNGYLSAIETKLSDSRERVQEVAKRFTELQTVKNDIAAYKALKLSELNKGKLTLLEQRNALNGHAIALKGILDGQEQTRTQKNEQIKSISAFLLTLKDEYLKASAELKLLAESVFVPIDADSTNCSSCGQAFPVETIAQMNEEASTKFNVSKFTKSEKLKVQIENITLRGKEEGAKRTVLELELKAIEEERIVKSTEQQLAASRLQAIDLELANQIPTTEINLTGDPEYDRLYALAMQIQTEINETQEESTEKLLSDKAAVQLKVDEIKAQLAGKTAREDAQKRIDELVARGKELSGLIASEKSTQYQAERFIRAKAEMLQGTINAMFENLSFRLFDVQINGGIVDDCTPLINGVEYKDASHSEQIRAGMDIIHAFQKSAETYVPVFVDNAEACTYLRQMDCQVIKLIVSEQDKKIRIERGN